MMTDEPEAPPATSLVGGETRMRENLQLRTQSTTSSRGLSESFPYLVDPKFLAKQRAAIDFQMDLQSGKLPKLTGSALHENGDDDVRSTRSSVSSQVSVGFRSRQGSPVDDGASKGSPRSAVLDLISPTGTTSSVEPDASESKACAEPADGPSSFAAQPARALTTTSRAPNGCWHAHPAPHAVLAMPAAVFTTTTRPPPKGGLRLQVVPYADGWTSASYALAGEGKPLTPAAFAGILPAVPGRSHLVHAQHWWTNSSN